MRYTLLLLALTFTSYCHAFEVPGLPRNHHEIKEPVKFAQLETIIQNAEKVEGISVSVEGNSVEGRPLYLVTASHTETPDWEVLFIGCQHGNEHSGKDAISYLLWDLAENPEKIPENVAIHLIPNSNPDGSEANSRRNSAGQDLNRDHLFIEQPETQTMHKVTARLRPDVVVDCHEFTRDSGDYTENGWGEWPLIMMDTANNPVLPEAIYTTGLRWVDSAAPIMKEKGYHYTRYYVGGTPPQDELRHSTLDVDDARNGLATYGGLGFIIEAGIKRSAPDPYYDLAERVDAYLILLNRFIHDDELIAESKRVLAQTREAKPYPFIPTNYFWGKTDNEINPLNVIELESGKTVELQAANFMNSRVTKNSVPMPSAYIIPEKYASLYRTLLLRHSIPFEQINMEATYNVEHSVLLEVQPEYDEIYNRYEDRQIVNRQTAKQTTLPAGHLLVDLSGEHARRAALVLEPSMLYGVMQHPEFRSQVGEDGIMPVLRVP